MPSNEYYDSTGAPSTGSHGASATMRAEFDAIEAGFIKMATLAGNANLPIFVNSGGTAQEAKSAIAALALLGINATAAEINTACDLTSNGFFTTGNVNKMLFYLDTAPTGWSIDTALDDKLVFVTKGSGAGGQTGGGAHSTGSWTISGITVDAHTHSGPSHTHTGPSHTHSVPIGGGSGYLFFKDADGASFTAQSYIVSTPQTSTKTGTLTTAGGTGATGAGGTGDTSAASSSSITADAAWRPAAYNCIVASLD